MICRGREKPCPIRTRLFLFFFPFFLALRHKILVQAVDCGRRFPGSLSDLGALLMPFYPEPVTLLRTCDSRGSGGNRFSTDHADFLTSSRFLCPQLIIIIFLVPFFGCLAVRLTICSRGTVFAVPLARRIDNILFPADRTMVNTAKRPDCSTFVASCS